MTEETLQTEQLPTETAPKEEVPVKKKRGRKPKGERKKMYFGEEEEEAFKRYINSTDGVERNLIFNRTLYPAFCKMVESIIRRYVLFTPYEDYEDTFNDTLSFLITKVNNFNPDKGYRAYSYCGTVCRNYLLLQRTQKQKRIMQLSSYDVLPFDKDYGSDSEFNLEKRTAALNGELISRTVDEVKAIIDDTEDETITEDERKVGYALMEILMNWEDIFQRIETKKFNKTAVMYFIREYTLLDLPRVRRAMKRYKNLYFFTKQKLVAE